MALSCNKKIFNIIKRKNITKEWSVLLFELSSLLIIFRFVPYAIDIASVFTTWVELNNIRIIQIWRWRNNQATNWVSINRTTFDTVRGTLHMFLCSVKNLKNIIHQIDSKKGWLLLSASCTAKFGLVFVLTLESAFS